LKNKQKTNYQIKRVKKMKATIDYIKGLGGIVVAQSNCSEPHYIDFFGCRIRWSGHWGQPAFNVIANREYGDSLEILKKALQMPTETKQNRRDQFNAIQASKKKVKAITNYQWAQYLKEDRGY